MVLSMAQIKSSLSNLSPIKYSQKDFKIAKMFVNILQNYLLLSFYNFNTGRE